MKNIFYFILAVVGSIAYSSCSEDEYVASRPEVPSELTATKGDTSVFLKWTPVANADYYVLIRGLSIIADSLKDTSFEDASAPDTLTEYRVYAVGASGWRSKGYAADSGYLGLPAGILPRIPRFLTASENNPLGCELKWEAARFASSYKIYRDGNFLAEVTDLQYTDLSASVDKDAKYEIFSVNKNGTSQKGATVNGHKSYYFIDGFETYANGSVINPWTFAADRIGYYTEGSPTVTTSSTKNGKQSLSVSLGKVQLLDDWGGVLYDGYYEVSFWAKKTSGDFTIGPNFTDWRNVSTNGEWKKFSVRTALLSKGNTFNVTLQNNDDTPLYIDDLAIEYIANDTAK